MLQTLVFILAAITYAAPHFMIFSFNFRMCPVIFLFSFFFLASKPHNGCTPSYDLYGIALPPLLTLATRRWDKATVIVWPSPNSKWLSYEVYSTELRTQQTEMPESRQSSSLAATNYNHIVWHPLTLSVLLTRLYADLCCLAAVAYTRRLFSIDNMVFREPQPNRSALQWADTTVHGTICHLEDRSNRPYI